MPCSRAALRFQSLFHVRLHNELPVPPSGAPRHDRYSAVIGAVVYI
jgi:hypothetical protein